MIRTEVKFPDRDTGHVDRGILQFLANGWLTIKVRRDDNGIQQVVTASLPQSHASSHQLHRAQTQNRPYAQAARYPACQEAEEIVADAVLYQVIASAAGSAFEV
jgi:hypothetical protein